MKSTNVSSNEPAAKVLVRGIHFNLSTALRSAAETKAMRLLRHHTRVMRIRIDLEHDHTRDNRKGYIATGRVEISGPDLVASVASDAPAKSLDLLIDRLDRMLREKTKYRANRRNDRPAGTEFRDLLAPPPLGITM